MKQKNNISSLDMTQQSGRSMVEMLGTLSIIGVLSVMGVVGYKMAMTRFRTNELLDSVSKRAALVAIQISNGSTSPVLGDLGGNSVSGMTFDTVSYTSGSDTFDLVITGVSNDIAAQIQNHVGGNSIIRDIDLTGSTLTLTFNKDLSAGGSSSNSNSGNSGNEQQPETPVDLCSPNPCQHGGSCSNGVCDCTGTGYTGSICETCNINPQTDCLSHALEEGECACVPAADDTECSSYNTNECGKNMYCHFKNATGLSCYDDGNGHPVTGNGQTTVVKGVCKSVTSINSDTTTIAQKQRIYAENSRLDWFSSNSWCIGKGSTGLISSSVLESEWGCSKEYEFCDNPYMIEAWTSEVYVDSCRAWAVDPHDQDYDTTTRSNKTFQRPLCE